MLRAHALAATALLLPVAARAALPVDSLLANGDFAEAAQLAGWELGNADATWTDLDVALDPDSGSVRIANAFPQAGFSYEISQCLATGAGPHALGAWYRVPGGQEAAGDPAVRWFFHAEPGCAGDVLVAGQVSTENIQIVPDVWAELSDEVDAPPGTDSVRFFLVNRRESSAGVFALHLDDAYLLAPAPEAASGTLAAIATLLGVATAQARRTSRAASTR